MRSSIRLLVITLLLCGAFDDLRADDPLHRRIDRLVVAGTDVPLAGRSSDAEFLRRVHLDLVGRVPTAAEVRAFLADESTDKRAKLVDHLLTSPEHSRRMAELFNVMLMERRGENEHWERFLRKSFEQNRPWDEVVRAILKPAQPPKEPAEGAEDEKADEDPDVGAAYFLTSRLVSEGAMAPVDVPGLTRDVGRLLAGVDLQCAQCHDHLTIDHYEQRHFQGLHVVFENVKPVRGDRPAVSEGLMTEPMSFQSVFTGDPMTTGPVVPGGDEITIPAFAKGEEYVVAPDRKKKIVGVPKFSPLTELALGLTSPENDLFAKNIVNRLWFTMLGRGLVEPLDLHHASNPPSHPELLDLLAREFVAHEFDAKWLLRELVLSETYQRTSRLPEETEPPPATSYAAALEKRLSVEQILRSVLLVVGGDDVTPATIDETLAADSSEKLRKNFFKAFANPPKEPELEFEPTVAAALTFLNDETFLRLLEPKDGNLVERLAKFENDATLADELYVSVLGRLPDDDERRIVAEHLAKHPDDRAAACGQLAWALLSSTEFLVNH